MFQKSDIKRSVLQFCNFGLLCGVALWGILLMHGAQELRGNGGLDSHEYRVSFGPLLLTTISKQVSEHGFTAGFSLGSGFGWYLAGWLVIGSLLGATLGVLRQQRHTENR